MPRVAINGCENPGTTTHTLLERVGTMTDVIRGRAFSLLQKVSGPDSSGRDDWLQAELDLVWSPPSELVDDENVFRARIAVPGFEAKDICMSVTPDALVVHAGAHTDDLAGATDEDQHGNISFYDFPRKQLFRRLDLPVPIDVEKVYVSLDKGVLQVTALKATASHMTASSHVGCETYWDDALLMATYKKKETV